ncbi:MAG: beta-mannosidase [Saprospiraceae bacterium]
MNTTELHHNWRFRKAGDSTWYEATVPGVVQMDLLRHGVIPDPFYGTNEDSIQWIEREDWIYETLFDLPNFDSTKNYELVFNGLDTYAEVTLNGEIILSADNMYRQWKVNVKHLLRYEKNQLIIYFRSPLTVNADKLNGTPYHKTAENDALKGEKVSVYARKAPYHFGWDWGPRIVTFGIWRPIQLVEWTDVILDEVQIYQQALSANRAELQAKISYRGELDSTTVIQIKNAATNEILATKNIINDGNYDTTLDFIINNPQFWWTHNLGKPHLYDFVVEISQNNQVLHTKSLRFGLRKLELIREKDAHGESFYFKLNGVPVFMKGANYIPSETMLPRRTTAQVDRILNDAKAVNMNMIRVWGGGIYEEDYFYDKCDEMGLLVWQDFMFACAMYPGVDTNFYENVKQEAIYNVKRLRNHASIAIWCGNNEIDIAWHNWGWQVRFGILGAAASEMRQSYEQLFQELLPSIVKQYDPQRTYVHSSPLSEGGKSSNLDNGCMHYWKPWNMNDDFDGYERNVGRYMNEYGFQSFPEMATIEQFATPADFSFDSEVMKKHQKSYIGNGRIGKFVDKYYTPPLDFADFVYKSQLVQAEGIRTAIRAHRRAMPRCMGTVYWQLDDCWPAPSWSSIDYYGRWKALHYALRELYADQLIVPWESSGILHVQIVNDALYDMPVRLQLECYRLNGKQLFSLETPVNLCGNESRLYAVFNVKDMLQKARRDEVFVRIRVWQEEKMVAQTLHYFAPPKDLKLQTPGIHYQIDETNQTLTLSANTLVKNLYLYADSAVQFADNYFDLLPGETKVVPYKGALQQMNLKWRSCNAK